VDCLNSAVKGPRFSDLKMDPSLEASRGFDLRTMNLATCEINMSKLSDQYVLTSKTSFPRTYAQSLILLGVISQLFHILHVPCGPVDVVQRRFPIGQ
jgi:hypothetical protein